MLLIYIFMYGMDFTISINKSLIWIRESDIYILKSMNFCLNSQTNFDPIYSG